MFTVSPKLNNTKKRLPHLLPQPVFILVFLVLTGLLFNTLSSIQPAQSQEVLGGPEELETNTADPTIIASDALALASEDPDSLQDDGGQDEVAGFLLIDSALAETATNPFVGGILKSNRDNLMVYRVEDGDTLSGIAQKFNLNVDTLFSGNPGLRATIRPGQEIVILPIPGALHTVNSGDTLSAIARRYGVEIKAILGANEIGEVLAVGQKLIIPGGKLTGSIASSGNFRLSRNTTGYFTIPTAGYNWGKIHGTNGVDIANACGIKVRASATGVVRRVDIGRWNGGYGGLIILRHDNGAETWYAHLQNSVVEAGQAVNQGQTIGVMGNTGRTAGTTGCHLHYEERGTGLLNTFAR